MIKLNKITKLSVTALLTTFLLAGCTSQSDDSKASSSSKARSEKLAKESSKKKEESKRKSSEAESERKASEASAKAESESKANKAQSSSEQSVASDQQQPQQAPSQAQQQASEQTSSEQTVSYGDLPPFDGTLSDFVNKYGVTPVVYKVQHYGMSVDEALQSTPDELQTSGEIQTEAGY